MMTTKRIVWLVAMAIVAATATATAQEDGGRPGWTFIPSFALSQTYDDNITLFGTGTADEQNDDVITSYVPGANLTFVNRRTRAAAGYGGSFLTYRNNGVFNRWDQRAHLSLRRAETPRVDWSLNGSATMRPSTEAIDFDGIPFSHTGATALNGRAGAGYAFGERHAVTSSLQLQKVSFDRPGELLPYLRGGRAVETFSTYRHRASRRFAVGAHYTFRQATVTGDADDLNFHVVRAAFDAELSPTWSVNAGAGFDYLMAAPNTPAQRAPGFGVAADRSAGGTRFHVGYQRLFLPSFGFGGAIQSQELAVTYHTPLFHSRRFYTDHAVMLRDSRPLVEAPGRLRLRSLRTNSVIGWAPQPWVQLEAFYARVQQTSLIPGGRLDRNRVGIQIVTSTPVRVQ
jgi:hypothetical protein